MRFLAFISFWLATYAAQCAFTGTLSFNAYEGVAMSIPLPSVTDGSVASGVVITNPFTVVLDLTTTQTVQRVFVTGTNVGLAMWPGWNTNSTRAPSGLIVAFVGNTPGTANQVATFTIPPDLPLVDAQIDLRFSPVSGRYVRLELQTNITWGVNYWPGSTISNPSVTTVTGWDIAEIEAYGFPTVPANNNAVVLDSTSNSLVIAASELSYYLGMLSGSPHPIIPSSSTNSYPGTLYLVPDLVNLAPDYSTMTNNIANGSLPSNVNVIQSGREVIFKAWPYRCVLWSVWEFLERQGVRWTYPDAHGDYVPFGNGVSTSMLPLQYSPSAKSIYANFDANIFNPWAPWLLQSVRQESLYIWRSRWNASENIGPLGGSEIPTQFSPLVPLSSDYAEGFDVFPHNFNNLLPNKILTNNPGWWGYSTNTLTRISPTNSSAPAFCIDQPAAYSWVAGKIIAWEKSYPTVYYHPLELRNFLSSYGLWPMDACDYCMCPQYCDPQNHPYAPTGDAFVKHSPISFSGSFYFFITNVANILSSSNSSAQVGALAYADIYEPPTNITRFPSNAQITVCVYGAPGASVSSLANVAMSNAWTTWNSKTTNLYRYDYTLLHTDVAQTDPRLPVPLASGIVDHAQFFAGIGAINGGCQATIPSFQYNPWNFYVYPRIAWNTNQTAAQLLSDFFNAYYGSVGQTMLSYYTNIENYQFSSGINTHSAGYCYSTTPGSYPMLVMNAMSTNLTSAESLASGWVSKSRVYDASNGFSELINLRALSGTNLSDTTVYPRISATTNMTISAFWPFPNRPSGNFAFWETDNWHFYAQGGIVGTLYFPFDGTWQITVSAKGVFNMGDYPYMNIILGSSYTNVYVNSTSYTNYTGTFQVKKGVWDLVLDYSSAPLNGQRYLYVNGVNGTQTSFQSLANLKAQNVVFQ